MFRYLKTIISVNRLKAMMILVSLVARSVASETQKLHSCRASENLPPSISTKKQAESESSMKTTCKKLTLISCGFCSNAEKSNGEKLQMPKKRKGQSNSLVLAKDRKPNLATTQKSQLSLHSVLKDRSSTKRNLTSMDFLSTSIT